MQLPDNITLGAALDRAARRWGPAIGWVFENRHVSFTEMRESSDAVACALLASGIGKGDVVAILTPNLPEFAYCLMACGKIGAILAPVNTRSKTFELEHILTHSRARVLVMSDRFLQHDYVELVQDLCGVGALGADGRVDSAALPHLRLVVGISAGTRLLPWAALLDRGRRVGAAALEQAHAQLQTSEPILLQYTSGTTAMPKGALCNHVYVVNFGAEIVERLGLREGEAFFNTQPFYHVGGGCGAIPTPLATGCRMVMPEYYDAERALGLIEREKCVARTGFAAMYIMELALPRFREYDLSSLRSGWCVGPADLMARIRDEMGIPGLIQIFGATECGGSSGDIHDPWDKRSESCGRAFPGTELAIFHPESGARLAAGEVGEIVCRGWWAMNGYLRQPEENERAIDAAGWVHTGDYGHLDEQGFLYFRGRLKNMLKVGGENVSAEEVEAMLMRHPLVKMAAVVGLPDARLGEVVSAYVELHAGKSAAQSDIIAFCAARMANFRVPRRVEFIREWPITGSGKIQKHLLSAALQGSPEITHPTEENP